MVKLPLNQPIQVKYAANEFAGLVYLSNQKPYIGYYYESNNRIFAGNTFSLSSPELTRIEKIQQSTLSSNPDTEAYAKLSNMIINTFTLKSIPFAPSDEQIEIGFVTRYFAKKRISNLIDIKEISQDTFKILSNDPLYQVLRIQYNLLSTTEEELNNFDKQMLGLKQYIIDTDNISTSSDENKSAEDEANGKFSLFVNK